MAKWVFVYGMHGYLPNFSHVYEGERDEVIQHVLEFLADDPYLDITGAKDDLISYGSWDYPGEHNIWYVSIDKFDPDLHSDLEDENYEL